MIAIMDYKAGNQTSVRRAFGHLGVPAVVTSDPKVMRDAAGVVFPGVGAAGQAMKTLKLTGMDEMVGELVSGKKPFLGICLGCQIMLESSEENETETLGIFKGKNLRFDPSSLDEAGEKIRIPHMGWNTVEVERDFPLWEGTEPGERFYFVHGYYPVPAPELVLGTTAHGIRFASVYGTEKVWAVQFHPEKSGPPGLKILDNFRRLALGDKS
ncbi:MAG: imidazole glycerol phosphate synthase subunit HisH [Deltaproteobacteria bacterium]|nr:imidazole glycerol phosphate synthase subunit HisH [Deltaproteobacteria bacterium]